MTSLTPPMLQAIVAGISSAALAGVLLPTMVDGIWRSVYLDMGDDPSCFAIATSDINHHATSSTLASGLGGSSGGFVEESSRSGGAPLSKLGLITGSALSPGTRPPARIQHTHKKQSRRKRLLRWQNYKLNARQKAAREHAINVWLKYGGFLPTEIMLPYGIERELKRLQALRTETAERASSWTHLGYAAWFVGGVLTIAGGLAGGALGSVPGAKVGAELGSLVGGVIGGLVGGCSASRIQQEGAYIEELVAKIDKRIRALKAEIQKRKDKVLEQHLQNLYRRSGR